MKKNKRQKEFAFAEVLKNRAAAEDLRGWLAFSSQTLQTWRGDHLIPPDSLLYHVIEAFRTGTDIALELPFSVALHYVAGLLLTRGVTLQLDATTIIDPSIWSVCLAESGGGKSITLSWLRAAFASDIETPLEGATGARSFFDGVKSHPRGVWFQDEFGQLIRTISDPKNANWKALMLRIGTGDDLLYSTGRDGEMVVRHPLVSLLGMTQTALWTKHVPPESLLDGLCARFAYVIARDDPSRPPQLFPRYKVNPENMKKEWARLSDQLLSVYVANTEVITFSDNYCTTHWPSDLPKAFARRLLYGVHRYALLYHVLSDPSNPNLAVRDYVYAYRLFEIFLHDGLELLGDHNMTELERILAAADRAAKRYLSAGKPFTIRDLIKSVRAIQTANTARDVWRFLWPKNTDYVLRPSCN